MKITLTRIEKKNRKQWNLKNENVCRKLYKKSTAVSSRWEKQNDYHEFLRYFCQQPKIKLFRKKNRKLSSNLGGRGVNIEVESPPLVDLRINATKRKISFETIRKQRKNGTILDYN